MPIEIRELIIRATVEEDSGSNSRQIRPSTEDSQNDDSSNSLNARLEEVKKMLKDKNER